MKVYKINMDKPFKKLTERQRDILLYGSGDKEIEFTFTQRQGGTRNEQWFSRCSSTADDSMNLLQNIHVK